MQIFAAKLPMLPVFLAPFLTAASAVVLSHPVQATSLYTSRVLVNNLANPRGLLVVGDQVLVSEAGSGGPALAGGGNCITSGAGTTLCSGFTGAIGSWNLASQSYATVLKGLPSLAQANGTEGTGLADLASGGPTGLLGIFGFGGAPSAITPSLPGSDLFAQVVSVDLSTSTLQPRANLASYEEKNNPDGGDTVSNPYGLQVFGGKVYATDAGGNSLLTLALTPDPVTGQLAIQDHFAFPPIAVIPPPFLPMLPNPFQASAVPTGLTANPSTNRLLIGEFSGFPFVPGSASVYSGDGLSSPLISLSGFTNITDVAADADGNTYILEYTANWFDPIASGGIWRVSSAGDRLRIIDGLKKPTSLALGADGAIYVSANADGLQGELLEYRPVPAPLPIFGVALAWRQARRLRQRLLQSR